MDSVFFFFADGGRGRYVVTGIEFIKFMVFKYMGHITLQYIWFSIKTLLLVVSGKTEISTEN